MELTATNRQDAIAKICNEPNFPLGNVIITITKEEDARSTDQNSLFYALYNDISKSEIGMTLKDAKRHCKLHIGLRQILILDKAYKKKWADILHSMQALDEEQKMILMDAMPVTSEFKKKQGSEYIDLVHLEFAPQGVVFNEAR